jgi:hypothetical protein
LRKIDKSYKIQTPHPHYQEATTPKPPCPTHLEALIIRFNNPPPAKKGYGGDESIVEDWQGKKGEKRE